MYIFQKYSEKQVNKLLNYKVDHESLCEFAIILENGKNSDS